ncbi:hypothetical protein Bca52824_019468 [Brassica carinata]|uniref:AAA-type ATPase N-terminal domain-containing protein n=1 Tax=Brassica carinata TaxID=52824 RepID=A0A8X7VS19_BRACI|nr:hypothetical protein Bca52824_019468 [Brassica carinata]
MIQTGTLGGFVGMIMPNLMFLWAALYKQFVPHELQHYVEKCFFKMIGSVSHSVDIRFSEYTGEGLTKSQSYNAIRNYLSSKSTAHAQRLKANDLQQQIIGS